MKMSERGRGRAYDCSFLLGNCLLFSRSNGGHLKQKSSRKAAAKQGIYMISGTKLNGETKDLPKGIYIVNGKKVVK